MYGRFLMTLLILCGLCLLSLVVFWLGVSQAHDWYTGSRNPVTGSSCCGRNDCVPIPDGDVRYEGGVIWFRYPYDGEWYSIPMDQTLPSRDMHSHGCVWGRGTEGGPKVCFFSGGAT